MACLEGDEDGFADIVEEVAALESSEKREVLAHALGQGGRDVRRESLKRALRRTMEKEETAPECVAALREAWAFLRAERKVGGGGGGGGGGGVNADLRRLMISAEIALIGGEGRERRIEEDLFDDFATEAKVNAVEILTRDEAIPTGNNKNNNSNKTDEVKADLGKEDVWQEKSEVWQKEEAKADEDEVGKKGEKKEETAVVVERDKLAKERQDGEFDESLVLFFLLGWGAVSPVLWLLQW